MVDGSRPGAGERRGGAAVRLAKSSRSNRTMKLRTGSGTGTITGGVHQWRPRMVTASLLTVIGPRRGSDAITALT